MFKEFIIRSKYIIKHTGFMSLIKRIMDYVFTFVFYYEVFCIRLHYIPDIRMLKEEDFKPAVQDCTIFIVSDNKEADELESQGFKFRSQIFRSREALDKGGIAFVVFSDKTFASIHWIAFNTEVQMIMGEPPVKVDFTHGEAITVGARTLPEFRQKGLFSYTMYKTREYLDKKGIEKCWGLTVRKNIASGHVVEKFHPQFIGYGYWWRILGIEFYWERKQIAGC